MLSIKQEEEITLVEVTGLIMELGVGQGMIMVIEEMGRFDNRQSYRRENFKQEQR